LQHFVHTDALPEIDEREDSMMAEDLLELKRIYTEILSSEINEVTKMLGLAIQHRFQVLHEYGIEFLDDHPALDAVMASKMARYWSMWLRATPSF
jgi:hypothetical protein